MPFTDEHRRGVLLFDAGDFQGALEAFRNALAQAEPAELWSDWAAAQFALGRAEEAEVGFQLALELEPEHADALINLVALLLNQGRNAEASEHMDKALTLGTAAQRGMLEKLGLEKRFSRQHSDRATQYLRSFLGDDENERSYFETHLRRYVETLALLPKGDDSQKLLELGAAFHHLTPALLHFGGYGEVRCNDLWTGERKTIRRIESRTGDACDFVVDNFDVQSASWPYADAAFDGVLCCEMLEHLHTDPMGLVSEINRVLKPNGALLLTTPNLACSHAIASALRGDSPYVYGKFERGGAPTDRHNREYTAKEVARLAEIGGFRVVTLKTNDSWWPRNRQVLRLLATQGHSIANRGDNTLLLARKAASVAQRYPEEFYQAVGTQAGRRALQKHVQERSVRQPEELRPCKVLVIHEQLPHFDRSGSDLRLLDVLRELRAQGHAVTYLARDGRDIQRYRQCLEDLNISVIPGDPERLRHAGSMETSDWSLAEILQCEKFDAALLFHWFWSGISIPEHYLEEIRRASPSTRIAVLTDDRHGERERRAAGLSGLLSDVERANDFEARELETYRRADLLLYIAEADRRHFAKFLPELPAELLPMVAQSGQPGPEFSARAGVLFLGNFDNLANRDALDWLLKEIWPRVHRESPDLRLYIAGHGAPRNMPDMATGVACIGHVANLGEAFAARLVFAAPLRFGTGINTKNLQSLAHGLPLVTTSIGAEGLSLAHQQHALIADDADAFAQSVLSLCRDGELWSRLSLAGRAFAATQFSQEGLRRQVRTIMARLRQIRPKPADSTQWSYREVEDAVPQVLTASSRYRPVLRTLGYWQLGRRHLDQQSPGAALAQFRHVFATLRGHVPHTALHATLLKDMARCYRALGNAALEQRCNQEMQRGTPLSLRVANSKAPKRAKGNSPPEISVVFPTCNRAPILRVALATWAFQSYAPDRWEVVIVDDGSTDQTQQIAAETLLPFSDRWARQENQGAGAARRTGVEAARGKYLLLCNDDTIPSSNLLIEHLNFHRLRPRESWAVLGQFRPREGGMRHALSLYVNTTTFFFPQSTLKAGDIRDQAFFVTCNLSVRRSAILAAGNFDPSFRVAEDTEVGARLVERGIRVVYHPAASAWHEHTEFTTGDLIRRAKAYGAANLQLLRKHPRLLGEGKGPFGMLAETDRRQMERQITDYQPAVAQAVAALEELDRYDLKTAMHDKANGPELAKQLLEPVGKVVPLVYWHYLLETFLNEWPACDPQPSGHSLQPIAQGVVP